MEDQFSNLLADLEAAQSDEARAWINMRFSLDSIPSNIQQIVWAAAVPHWFDREFLAALLDDGKITETEFNSLLELSYIEEFPGRGWNVHERTRELLLAKLWEEQRQRYRELSRRAASYCHIQDQDDVIWRAETLYHQLIAGETKAVSDFSSQGIAWHNQFEYKKIEVLIAPILAPENVERVSTEALAWAYYRQGRLDIKYGRYREARMVLEKAVESDTSDNSLLANCIKALGDVHYFLAEYREAREKYEEARPIYTQIGARLGEANCIQALGGVHYMLAEYREAREKYEEARPIYAQIGSRLGEANCIQGLGGVHYMLAEYREAREKYEEARPIYTQIGARLGEANCGTALGEVSLADEDYQTAATWFERSWEAYQEMDEPHWSTYIAPKLARALMELGELEKAKQILEKGAELSRSIAGEPNLSAINELLETLSG